MLDITQTVPDVTQILTEIGRGDMLAAERLLPLVYDELRRLAACRMAHEKPGQTLDATALVNEAYLRLVKIDGATHWDNRGHFFAAAAEAMRRILVERARQKLTQKMGGSRQRVPYDDGLPVVCMQAEITDDLLALDAALREFEAIDPIKAELVKLRYFTGLTLEEAAEAQGVSVATVKRNWVYAKSWLYGKLHEE